MIQRTVAMCLTCRHPKRKEIEDKFLLTGQENFRAFCREIEKDYDLKFDSVKSHFKGRAKNGFPAVPHFSLDHKVDFLAKEAETMDMRRNAEHKVLTLVNERLDDMLSKEEVPEVKELVALLKTVVGSQDNRRTIDIKENEVRSKQKNFDKLFNKSLYGGFDDDVIQDAIICEPLELPDKQ